MATIPMLSAAGDVIEPPDLWTSRLTGNVAARAPRLTDSPEGPVWILAGATTRPLVVVAQAAGRGAPSGVEGSAWLASADGRRWLQERDGLDGEVLYARSEVWRLLGTSGDAELMVACCAAYNDWLAEFCAHDPERFVGIAKIPTTGLDDAVGELQRACGELGLRGALLDAWPSGSSAEGPPARASAPFWKAAEELGVPISLHRSLSGSEPAPASPLTAGYASELWVDLSVLIYANVCDDFPGMRFVVVDPSPGWVPMTLEGLDENYMRTAHSRKVNLGDAQALPSDYLRRHFWYTVQQDRFSVLNRAYFGTAHLMWASFTGSPESVWPNNRQEFARVTSGIPETDQRTLAGDVVARLYGLRGADGFSDQELLDFEHYALL